MSGDRLDLTREPAVLETADSVLEEPSLARRDLWRAISSTDGLVDGLERALRELVDADDDAASLDAKLLEADVDALDGTYRRALIDATAHGSDGRHDLVRLTRQLGRPISLGGLRSSLDDVRDGPIALLEAADVAPDLAIDLRGADLLEHRAAHVSTLLEFLTELSAGLSISLVVTGRQQRRLAREHADALPASVTAVAESGLPASPSAEDAREVAEDLGLDAAPWRLLRAVLDVPSERRSYHDLATDPAVGLSRAAVRKQAERLAHAGDDGPGLVVREQRDGAHVVAATPLARPALDYRDEYGPALDGSSAGSPPRDGGATGEVGEEPGSGPAHGTGGVTDPPNTPDGDVLTRPRTRAAPDGADVDAEAEAVTDRAPVDGTPGEYWDRADAHHAAVSAVDAADADVVLADRPADWGDREPGDRLVSYDPDRDDVVVRIRWSHNVAASAARLGAALASDRVLEAVLTERRIDGVDGAALEGLAESNPIVLRDARCIGWLPDGADAEELREHLRTARNDLLALTDDLRDDAGELREDVAGEVARLGHGLAGTIVDLLDLLDVDVHRVLEIPEYGRDHHSHRETLLEFVGRAASISSRYGHYSGYRILHEQRAEKREDALGTPAVDPDDPVGEHMGSWVLAGPGVSRLGPDLRDHLEAPLPLQEDGAHFARFTVDVDVGQAWRREAVATVATRIGRTKSLEATRRTVSLLVALTGSVRDAARVVYRLPRERDRQRDLLPRDLRYGLTADDLPAARIAPDLPPTVGRALRALLEADAPLSQRELAERADLSTQALRDHRETLEALGLVAVQEGGAGRATTWRVRIPSVRVDQLDADEPGLPTALNDAAPGERGRTPIQEAVYEMLLALDHPGATADALTWTSTSAAAPLELVDRWPELRPLLEVVAALVGLEVPGRIWPPLDESLQEGDGQMCPAVDVDAWRAGPADLSTGWGRRPPRTQATLSAFKTAIGAD